MKWPQNKSFAVFLSHDIDRIEKKWFHTIYYFLKQRRLYHLATIFSKNNPYWTFESVLELEAGYGAKSTFFFLLESIKFNLFEPKNWKLSLGRYNIFGKKIQKVIKKIDAMGWEIGLHGSFGSFNKENLLKDEKAKLEKVLGKKIFGVRQHYLNLRIPETWKIQRNIGLIYDSSFGYKRETGFKNNRYIPFGPFNDNFLVIPITIMDENLFDDTNDSAKAWQNFINLVNLSQQRKAVLSILWHNNLLNPKEFPEHYEIYKKILAECQKRNAWFATGRELCKWINKNKRKERNG